MTTQFSYHVSQEQFSPRQLLRLVEAAERAGFDAAFSSDHINPWLPSQGQSGFIWSWLGAALQATQHITLGGITIPGGSRYHPAVIAQAIGTLGEMFPGRVPWIAVGSGEALNECAVSRCWLPKTVRDERLRAAARIIRQLLAGQPVTSREPFELQEARVWSRPEVPARLVAAALSEATASWAADWADGLLTLGTDFQRACRIAQAFRATAGEKEIHLKVDLSWAPSEEEALLQAHEQWRCSALGAHAAGELRTPEEFERAAQAVMPEQLRQTVLISCDLDQHIAWLRERLELAPASMDLHNVGRNQSVFIDTFGKRVLPALRGTRRRA